MLFFAHKFRRVFDCDDSVRPVISSGHERWRQIPTMEDIHSFICAPLLVQDQPIGILAVGSIDETPYTQEDAETVFAFATQVAIAMYNAQLHAEVRTRIERELLTAQEIKKSLLPHDVPEIPGLEIAGFSQPAREVGGDFFNVFVFDRQHLSIAVGDVSGKGMEAALMMALSFGLLTTEVRRVISPSALMNTLNREFRPHTKHNKMNTARGYLALTAPNGTTNGRWTLQAVNAGLIRSPCGRRGRMARCRRASLRDGQRSEVLGISRNTCTGRFYFFGH